MNELNQKFKKLSLAGQANVTFLCFLLLLLFSYMLGTWSFPVLAVAALFWGVACWTLIYYSLLDGEQNEF